MKTPNSTMNGHNAVELEHVTRAYRRDEFEVRALDDVSLQIPARSFVSIMGPSGSGKTTMLNLIAGIDHATSGRVAVGREENSCRFEAFSVQRVGPKQDNPPRRSKPVGGAQTWIYRGTKPAYCTLSRELSVARASADYGSWRK